MAATSMLGAAAPQSTWVQPGSDGKLVYRSTERGDHIPDFSNCGYAGGGVALPNVPVRQTLQPSPHATDDTPRIQAALDALAAEPADGHGERGAVLLARGQYHLAGTLQLRAAGMVLRGEGQGEDGTVLHATGKRRGTLISVQGPAATKAEAAAEIKILDDYVAVGANTFNVAAGASLSAGQSIHVRRHGNAAWIHAIGMDQITPRPGHADSTKQWSPFDLEFDRVIAGVIPGSNSLRIVLDAPLTCAIDKQWGGGDVVPFIEGRPTNIGVESLRAVSDFNPAIKSTVHDNAKDGPEYQADEDHCESFVEFSNVANCWARNLTGIHFSTNLVGLLSNTKWITVQDCACREMVSVITGGRRYAYYLGGAQLCLFERCLADTPRHAFIVNAHVCGPNVFLDSKAGEQYNTSEPHHRWSVGTLFDNIHANIAIQDRQWMGSGHGWAGANSVAWNCEGILVCQNPPTAQNWAIGQVGQQKAGAFKREAGLWDSLGAHVAPKSLYLAQLQQRLGEKAVRLVTTPVEKIPDADALLHHNAKDYLPGADLPATSGGGE